MKAHGAMSTLNYSHLRYFWAVAHDGNLTRAAERLHVSQSAVSVQIQKLEAELGHDLFERRGKQLVLTEAGRIALDHADAIFAMGDELVGTLTERGSLVRQVLRVGALATLSRNFQLGFLQPLLGREDVEVVVRSGAFGDLLQNLEAHRLDVVLSNTAPPRDAATSWVSHALAEQPVSLVGPPRRSRRKRTLEQVLAEEPLVLPSAESSIRMGFDALVDRLGIRPRIAAEVDDMAMLRLLAREHAGLAVVPSIVVKDELDEGLLVEIDRLPGLRESFYAITQSRRFPNPLLRELLGGRG
jgi:LysR family transcriptional activator of nhaA